MMLVCSFPRRQQYRRLRRAAGSGAAGLAACVLVLIAAGAGTWGVAGALLLVAVGFSPLPPPAVSESRRRCGPLAL